MYIHVLLTQSLIVYNYLTYMYTYMYLANTDTVHVYTCIINTESDSIQLF